MKQLTNTEAGRILIDKQIDAFMDPRSRIDVLRDLISRGQLEPSVLEGYVSVETVPVDTDTVEV